MRVCVSCRPLFLFTASLSPCHLLTPPSSLGPPCRHLSFCSPCQWLCDLASLCALHHSRLEKIRSCREPHQCSGPSEFQQEPSHRHFKAEHGLNLGGELRYSTREHERTERELDKKACNGRTAWWTACTRRTRARDEKKEKISEEAQPILMAHR